jgi:prepilin-type processing-associated H-X9-DG protein
LLVVVGIITVLTSMLIPMANKVLAIGKQTACASNMRQIYAACIAYAGDHSGFYPITPSIGDSGNPSWAYWMLPNDSGDGQIDFSHGQLWQYLDPAGGTFTANTLTTTARYRIFNCPADDDDPRLTRWGTISLYPRNFSYSFNIEMRQRPVGGSQGWRTGVRVAEVQNPAQKIIVVEEQWPNDGLSYLGWVDETSGNFNTNNPSVSRDADDVLSARHGGLGNQAYADGHVAAIDPRALGFNIFNIQFGTTSGPTNTNNLVAANALDLFYH